MSRFFSGNIFDVFVKDELVDSYYLTLFFYKRFNRVIILDIVETFVVLMCVFTGVGHKKLVEYLIKYIGF